METIALNLLLLGIILGGTSWGFYKIIQLSWNDSDSKVIEKNIFLMIKIYLIVLLI